MSKDFPSIDRFKRRVLAMLPDKKGMLIVHDGATVRKLPIGADNALPFADDTDPLGIKWTVFGSKDEKFLDNVKLQFGTDCDLEIYHDGTDNFIESILLPLNILSGALDADGVTCLDLNTKNTITAGGVADSNLRELLRVRNNGTEAFQVYASGVAYAAGGLWMGKRRPIDVRYPATPNRWVYDASDGEHVTLFHLELTNLNATVTNKNHLAADFRVVYQPATATQTGVHRGLSMFFDMKDSGTTNTISGATGGFFNGRFNGLHTVTPVTCTIFSSGSFEFSDLSDPASNAVMTQIRYVSVGGGSMLNCSVGSAFGVYIQDITSKGSGGPTLADAIRVLAQVTNGAAEKGNINMRGGDWNDGHLQLDIGHIWFDGAGGTLRGKTSAPVSASDGTDLLGGGASGDSFLEWGGL